MSEQFTTEQAIAFYESGAWREMDDKTKALFQIEQDKLCMPFREFHGAVERTIGRPVWTHEFGLNRLGLMAELRGHGSAPTFAHVMAMLPAEKVVIVATEGASP